MFYFLLNPYLMYKWLLILAAIVPAVFLMIKVYRSDRMERESGTILRKMIVAGILATLLAMVEERIGEGILSVFVDVNSLAYQIILYFGIVAIAEESSKYIFMRRRSWNSPEFNCQYDGVVYAVFTSLGFALWENINYVLTYGFSTALVRAVTAIPGHACFGVFMGIFYGLARKYENYSRHSASLFFQGLALIVPMLLHGAYDFIASNEYSLGTLYFFIFIALLFAVSFAVIHLSSKKDEYI